MKLLMISGYGATSLDKKGAFYNTLEEFHKYWERIDIISPRAVNGERQNEVLFGNVFLHPSPWALWLQPIWIFKKGLQTFLEQKFNIIMVHEYPPFYNGIGARLLWGKIKIPYVLETHHVPGYPKSANFKDLIYKFATRLFIRYDSSRALAVRVVNQRQTQEFLLKSGVPLKKIVHIPSFYIDLDVFRPMALIKEYDLIFIGRLDKNKGLDLLLDAVKNLKINIQNIKLLIVGTGPEWHNLKSKIKNLKLGDNVVLYGWAKDSLEVAEFINKSKILVMTSYSEGGPRVVLESMACGVPVVATMVGIVPDVIIDGESGSIADWDWRDLSFKISDLLSHPDVLTKYGVEGIKISKNFEKKSAIKKLFQELQKLIATEGGSAAS